MSRFYPRDTADLNDLLWPYDSPPPFQADSSGQTTLHFDGSTWHWSCYEWGEVNRKREATHVEVIDTLTAAWVGMCEKAQADADALALGKALVRALNPVVRQG